MKKTKKKSVDDLRQQARAAGVKVQPMGDEHRRLCRLRGILRRALPRAVLQELYAASDQMHVCVSV